MEPVVQTACPPEDLIATFASGDATPTERSTIEQHVDGCSHCQDLLAELAATFAPHSPERSLGSAGRYELVSVLGQGGMGIVYEARDPVLGRRVAVKVIDGVESEAERLLREGRAMARVAHVNVVTVFDAGVTEGRVFIAMDLVRGGSLRTHLAERRSPLAILALFREAARGLAAAHAAGVVHRDFKPENVLVGADAVRVTDFGLARPLREHTAEAPPLSTDARWFAETIPHAVQGTPAYLSPEQIDGAPVGPASDQFSFGVALHEALYGQHPFGLGETNGPRSIGELRAAMARGPRASEPPAELPLWVPALVERMLAMAPGDRWSSMDDVAMRLEGPGEQAKRPLGLLVNALVGTTMLHAAILALISGAVLWPEPADVPAWGTPLDYFAGYVFLVWGSLGAVAAPLAAWGLHRRARWAYLLTVTYAIAAAPTVLGTPVALVALHALTQPAVQVTFGRKASTWRGLARFVENLRDGAPRPPSSRA